MDQNTDRAYDIVSPLDQKIEYFTKWQVKILDLQRETQEQMNKYKAEMKATFGLADGDQTNVLELISTIKKIKEM